MRHGVTGEAFPAFSRAIATLGLLVVLAAMGIGCKSETAPEGATAPAGPGSRVGDAQQAAVDDAARQDALTAARRQIGELEDQLSEVRQMAAQSGGAAQQQATQVVESLATRIAGAKRSLEAAEQATGETWQQASADLESTVEQVRSGLASAERQVTALAEEERRRAIEAMKPLADRGLVRGLDGVEYLAYSREVVQQVQEKLRSLGLYSGPVDGYLEPSTQKALARFQEQQETWPSGVPSPKTRELLLGGG